VERAIHRGRRRLRVGGGYARSPKVLATHLTFRGDFQFEDLADENLAGFRLAGDLI
jgi:hypothetical protein